MMMMMMMEKRKHKAERGNEIYTCVPPTSYRGEPPSTPLKLDDRLRNRTSQWTDGGADPSRPALLSGDIAGIDQS